MGYQWKNNVHIFYLDKYTSGIKKKSFIWHLFIFLKLCHWWGRNNLLKKWTHLISTQNAHFCPDLSNKAVLGRTYLQSGWLEEGRGMCMASDDWRLAEGFGWTMRTSGWEGLTPPLGQAGPGGEGVVGLGQFISIGRNEALKNKIMWWGKLYFIRLLQPLKAQ